MQSSLYLAAEAKELASGEAITEIRFAKLSSNRNKTGIFETHKLCAAGARAQFCRQLNY